MSIPFSPPYIDQAVIDEVLDVLHSNWITTGPKCAALETEMTRLTQCKAALCVNSWTSGAILALKWFGIGPGDEVIVPAYTYSATALAVLQCGAKPVMVDVTDDFTINTQKIKETITARTKAIMPVDFAGWPCDYDEIGKIINDPKVISQFAPASDKQRLLKRILILSDAAHSIGSLYKGKPAALGADITIFSFHAVKNVTTAEGGCLCLNLPASLDCNAEHEYLKRYSLNGQTKTALEKQSGNWRYDILFPGLKINMPDICAAIGLAQLKKYETDLLPRRKAIAFRYQEKFKSCDWFLPPYLKSDLRESSYHLFPLRIKGITESERDNIISRLTATGISVNVHFIPMPMLTCFKDLGYSIDDYPCSYAQYSSEISLPIYPQLKMDEVDFIIKNVIEAVRIQISARND